jgi:hypothetical protein
MSFQNNGKAVTVSLVGQLTNQLGTAANPGYNIFGWYQINPNGTIGAMTPLWNSKSDTIGEAATFTPNGNYGLYLENIQSSTADYFWFMNSADNISKGGTAAVADSSQHFAVFSGTPGQFFIGVDDTNNGNADYNNMIIELVNAPEPRTFGFFGISLLVGGLLLSRRNKTVVAAAA